MLCKNELHTSGKSISPTNHTNPHYHSVHFHNVGSFVICVPRKSLLSLCVSTFKRWCLCVHSFKNLCWYVFQRLIVCLEESLYVHNIRDMKVIHTIRSISANPNGLCDLSSSNECSYLAYPGSSRSGTVQIFDTITLVCSWGSVWTKHV